MSLIDGLSQHTWENQTLYAYKLSENEHLGLVSLPWGQVQNISNFMNVTKDDKGNTIKVNFVLNCHYFDMAGGTNGYLGRCQSFTADARTLGVGEDGFDGYDGGTDKPYTDLVILNDGTIKYGDFNSWDYPKSEVILGVAPAGIELDNGEDKNWYSPACGYGKITNANTQSLLLKMDDGRFALVAVTGSLSPLACRDWTKSVGGTHQSCYDSGGSTQAIVRNSDGTTETIRNTSRKIPTAFVAYEIVSEDEGDVSEPEGGTTPPENTDPVVPENPPVEEEITGSLVHDRINKIKNEKENIKTVLINKGIVMENIPFTEYHNKINELSNGGNIPAGIDAIYNTSWESDGGTSDRTYASTVFDSGNNNKKGLYLCIRNASSATVYGSNDQSDWQTIINSNTGGSNDGPTGTPKNKVSEDVEFRYFKTVGKGYNNGNPVLFAWGVFEAAGNMSYKYPNHTVKYGQLQSYEVSTTKSDADRVITFPDGIIPLTLSIDLKFGATNSESHRRFTIDGLFYANHGGLNGIANSDFVQSDIDLESYYGSIDAIPSSLTYYGWSTEISREVCGTIKITKWLEPSSSSGANNNFISETQTLSQSYAITESGTSADLTFEFSELAEVYGITSLSGGKEYTWPKNVSISGNVVTVTVGNERVSGTNAAKATIKVTAIGKKA